MSPSRPQHYWYLLGWLSLWLASTGCSSLTTTKTDAKPWPWSQPEAEPKLPARILTIWTDAVHHQSGQKAQRGFGGRVVFYAEANGDPIRVDGKLTIYVFPDEPGTDGAVPERKFVFGADELQRHYSKSSLGDSYSVWLPWDAVGGPSRQLTLIARFDGTNGGTVMSEPAKKMLPGVSQRIDPDASPTSTDPRSLRTAAAGDPSEPNDTTSPANLSARPSAAESEGLGTATDFVANPAPPRSMPQTPRPLSPAASAPRSIADFLRQQSANSDNDTTTDEEDRPTANPIQTVGYWSPNEAPATRDTRTPRGDARVETIDLGQLPSNRAGTISVPSHWLQNRSMATVATDTEAATEFVQSSDNATVYYGRPGQVAPTGLGAGRFHDQAPTRAGDLQKSGPTPSLRANFNTEPASSSFGDRRSNTTDRVQSGTSDQDAGSQGSDERYDGEQWPRQSRTLGSNRRSIAEQRQQQIRQIPQNRPGMNP